MVQYASGSIKFSGLGSDTDFQAMIDKLAKIENRYVNQLLRWKQDWQTRLDAFKEVRKELLNLQTSLSSINSVNKFLTKTAASSDEKVATAVAGADTLNGTYNLEVNQLASQYAWSKNTNLHDKNTVITSGGDGEFTYSYRGVQRSLFVPNGTTLEGLKNLINNDAQNLGVRAQLITSQNGIVFQLQSKETGIANSLIIQNITNMPDLGPITLSGETYIDAGNSMTLMQGFSTLSTYHPINSTAGNQTFVFTVDGKKASISVPPYDPLSAALPPPGTVEWLVGEINTWGHTNLPPHDQDIASLELDASLGGDLYFSIKKQNGIYGAGTYSPALTNVLNSSYSAGTDVIPAGAYDITVVPTQGSAYTVPITLTGAVGDNDLNALLTKLQAALIPDATAGYITDPNDPSKIKLNIGPAVDANMATILNTTWNNSTQPINPTVNTQYQFRLTNSDTGANTGDIVTITLPAGSPYTIQEFCNSINSAMGSKGTARLVETSPGAWKLVIENNAATHRVTVEDGTLADFEYKLPQDPNWQVQTGQNARLRLNGWPQTGYLESASNTIAAGDLIDGMSLSLRGTGTTVITVGNDTAKIAENVEKFVYAVNSFRTILQSLTAFDEEKTTLDPDYAESQYEMQKGSVLTGNYGIQLLSSRLKSVVAATAVGFSHQMKDPTTGFVSGDIFSALSQIGITTNADKGHANYGLLEINRIGGYKGLKSFDDALAENPEAIARLFSTKGQGISNDPSLFQYNSHIHGMAQPGTYDVEYTISSTVPPTITGATINGKTANVDNTNRQIILVGPDGDPARSIMLDIYDMTPGTHKGSVSIKDGKVNELLSMMDGTEGLLGSGGTLSNLEKNYQTIIENIEKKIKQEDDRLVKWRRTMDLKFSRLEATLAKYNSINESLKTQITQLNSQNKN